MLQEQLTLPIGAIIQDRHGERYVVEDLLGQGGFSAVYQVRERRGRQRHFALKEMIDPDSHERSQLAFEADLLRKLNHRALPHVYQVFENAKINRIYMLMDYIEGKDLEALRREQPEKRFSLALSLALMTPVVDAVSYLHTRTKPIIHRDIKPANIIVPVGTGDAMLVDFGLAKEYVEDKTTNVFRYGTPGYAAPEQYGQGTNPRTDIYALGATLYTLLTGKIPVDALTRSVERQGQDPLQPIHQQNPHISPAISQVIEKAMSLRSHDRYTSVEDFWQHLSMAVMPTGINQLVSAPLAAFPPALSEQDKHILATTRLLKPSEKNASTSQSQKQHVRKRTYKYPQVMGKRQKILLGLLGLIIMGIVVNIVLFSTVWKNWYTQGNATPTIVSIVKTPSAAGTSTPANFCRDNAANSNIQEGDTLAMAPCYAGTALYMGGGTNKTLSSNMFLYNIQQTGNSYTAMLMCFNQRGKVEGQISESGYFTFKATFESLRKVYIFEAQADTDRLVGQYTVENIKGEKTGEEGTFTISNYNPENEKVIKS